MRGIVTGAIVITAVLSAQTKEDWPFYGRDAGGSRFSPLTQIDKKNVATLKIAWEFHTGDVSDGSKYKRKSEFETTPILVDGTLYLTTPFNRVIGLDPETGKQKWSYDPHIDLTGEYSEGLVNRGVASWLDWSSKKRRIFIATIDARLIAIDAATGNVCTDFGTDGAINLKNGIRNIERKGEYEETSPPAVIDDLVVVGSSIADNDRVASPDGVVRAYDARTGKLRWSWEPIPDRLAPTGAGNAWSIISVDAGRDLVFVPTGSASPDYHGGKRPGDDKWANSVVALRGKTGEFVWGFQLVHHDLWDYDTAPQPVLGMLRRNGSTIPVVIQGNKTGNLFVLNRDTGKPVFRVEERPVLRSEAEGESASPTQPFPLAPPPVTRQTLSVKDAWGATEADRTACQARMNGLRADGMFTPPVVKGIAAFPGNLGGMNWSGGSFDPTRQLFITNVNNIAMEVFLIPRELFRPMEIEAEQGRLRGDVSPQHGAPFGMRRTAILAPSGLPCVPPPWGSLVAVNLSTGKIAWNVPLGSVKGVEGSPNLGGLITTQSGLTFIAAAMDDFLRAFDSDSGRELWKGALSAGGQATPMTYQIHGKQYVVIAAGGHGKLGTKLGDSVVAFALP